MSPSSQPASFITCDAFVLCRTDLSSSQAVLIKGVIKTVHSPKINLSVIQQDHSPLSAFITAVQPHTAIWFKRYSTVLDGGARGFLGSDFIHRELGLIWRKRGDMKETNLACSHWLQWNATGTTCTTIIIILILMFIIIHVPDNTEYESAYTWCLHISRLYARCYSESLQAQMWSFNPPGGSSPGFIAVLSFSALVCFYFCPISSLASRLHMSAAVCDSQHRISMPRPPAGTNNGQMREVGLARLLAGHFLEPSDAGSALVIRSTWMPLMSGEPAKVQHRQALGQHR